MFLAAALANLTGIAGIPNSEAADVTWGAGLDGGRSGVARFGQSRQGGLWVSHAPKG